MSGAAVVLEPAPREGPSVRNVVRLQRLATGLAVAAIAECVAVVLISAGGDERFPISLDLVTIGFLGSVILFPVVGALIIQRRPMTRLAWLMIVTGVGLGLGLLTFGYGTTGMPPAPARPLALQALVLSQLMFIPSIACGTALLLLVFPTDRLLGPRWRIVVVITLAGAVLYELGKLLHRGDVDTVRFPGLQNPVGAPVAWAQVVDLMAVLGNALVTAAVLLAAFSLLVRYRRADVVEAAQIRWIALVAGLAAVAFAISSVPIDPESEVAFGIGLVLLSGTPIAIGIAITRYRLFDIDRLINRTLVYGSLTAILAGVFTAAIALAQRAFVAVTGEKSDAAIVLTTLVVATLYAPLRKRLEAIVDRRFRYESADLVPIGTRSSGSSASSSPAARRSVSRLRRSASLRQLVLVSLMPTIGRWPAPGSGRFRLLFAWPSLAEAVGWPGSWLARASTGSPTTHARSQSCRRS